MSNKGDFGHRNREGRSGLDPVESRAEMGRATGFFISKILFGRIRTHNPVVIGLMALFGLLLIIPLAFAIFDLLAGVILPVGGWVVVIVSAAFGAGLLKNAVINLFANPQ